MFRRDLLPIVRPSKGSSGLEPVGESDGDETLNSGLVREPASGRTYPVRHGYLDLLAGRLGDLNVANLTNLLPLAGRLYEPLWRVRSLTLLTGERFPNGRELDLISHLVLRDGAGDGLYLDLGCSAGLYSRGLPGRMAGRETHFVGVDISPSMLREAARRVGDLASLLRADAQDLPFGDATFSGAVCGGSLNEIRDPLRALLETRRTLAPGGRLAIMGILRAKTERGKRLQHLLSTGGLRFFEEEQLLSLLGHAGFEPDPLRTFGPVFFAGATRR